MIRMLFVIFLFVSMAGCGDARRESERWRASFDEAVTKLQKSVDSAALAIPGERYMRLIDTLNDPNASQEDKDRARLFVNNLFNVEPDARYRLSLRFGFDETKSLAVSFFYGASNRPESVMSWCGGQGFFNPTPVNNTLRTPPTDAEIDEYINDELFAAINGLGASIKDIKYTTVGGGGGFGGPQPAIVFQANAPGALDLVQDSSPLVQAGQPYLTVRTLGFDPWRGTQAERDAAIAKAREVASQTERHRQAARRLRNALDAIYGDLKRRPDGPALIRDYRPLVDDPYLFVVIPEEEIAAQPAEAFEASAIVYEASDTEGAPLDNMWPVRISKERFYDFDAVPCGSGGHIVRFAVHSLLRDSGLNPRLLDAILESKALLAAYEEGADGG
jgi:hypothetical protein